MKNSCEKYCDEYFSQDIYDSHPQLSFLGELKDYDEANFDSIICNSVLEHDPNPELLLKEINKKLKSGGTLIISVPHLYYMHGVPHDYYRFTKYGLKYILEKNGFSVKEMSRFGSIFSLLLSAIPVIVFALFGKIPLLNKLLLLLNSLFSYVIYKVEELALKDDSFASCFVAVAHKD